MEKGLEKNKEFLDNIIRKKIKIIPEINKSFRKHIMYLRQIPANINIKSITITITP